MDWRRLDGRSVVRSPGKWSHRPAVGARSGYRCFPSHHREYPVVSCNESERQQLEFICRRNWLQKGRPDLSSSSARSSCVFSLATSTISLPLVLFLSRWFAFFSICCCTRSRVVRYSSANSDTIRQNSFGRDSGIRCWGTPSQSRNFRYLSKRMPRSLHYLAHYRNWRHLVHTYSVLADGQCPV